MSNWSEISLGEVCSKITDGSHYSPKESPNGLPMFSVKDMNDSGFDYSKVKTVSRDDYDALCKQGCQPDINDVLIAKDGSVLKHIFFVKSKPDYVLLSSIAILRPKTPLVNPAFLVYSIKNPQVYDLILSNFVSGSGVPRIVLKDFKRVEIALPPLPEQEAIAEVLSSLDDKIDLLHRNNKTLEQLAETLFRQWFVEEADDTWETLKISDVADINKKSVSKVYPFSEIEYLDTGSITNGMVSEYQQFLVKDAPSRAQRIVKKNDIVYSIVRPNQRHFGLLQSIKPNTIASTGFCVISCRHISPYFIYCLLTLSESIDYFDMVAEASTSTYPTMKPTDVGNFEFQMPSKNKLEKFDTVASNIWTKIDINQNQIRTLTNIRNTLLPKLMSGEVTVNSLAYDTHH